MTATKPHPPEESDPAEEPNLLSNLGGLVKATVTRPSPELVVIAIGGELDMANGELLRRAIARAIDRQPQRILVDLAAVTFFGSSGMNVLAQGQALAFHQGIRLQLRGTAHRAVAIPLRVTGLENHFNILD
jgi:anti-anti-sigma factor